eukprot:gnl/MRDRNA2_/MRDRNA2_48591_c0_seq1.p1 gnl/MRDRNA2_/MRDRNA2_48591_c0~~gnl/MRDRNA2_/MRDRNA2_48591_c0_seq1.p1  ORF type:complete len:1025 (-),score=188.35 gnl/MRDRNA2_/MRDRNA2_48591_c0_seq1:43-3117(-)
MSVLGLPPSEDTSAFQQNNPHILLDVELEVDDLKPCPDRLEEPHGSKKLSLEQKRKSGKLSRDARQKRSQRLLREEHREDDIEAYHEHLCVCGESLDLNSSAKLFGIPQPPKSAQSVAQRQVLLNHGPMVLKMYFKCCNQLKLRPNSGVVRSIDQGAGDKHSCFCACKHLKLDHHGLGDEGLLAVMRIIGVCPKIERLDLKGNDLTDAGLEILIEGIINSLGNLCFVELGQNPKMSARSKRLLLILLLRRARITYLGLEGTGLTDMERDILYLQMLWNQRQLQNEEARRSRKSGRNTQNFGMRRSLILNSRLSPAFVQVEQIAERFGLLEHPTPDGITIEPAYPEGPKSLDENVWDTCRQFDAAVALHRRWVLECSLARKEMNVRLKEAEEQKKAREKRARSKNICLKWEVLVRIFTEKAFHLYENEYELMLILNRDLPKSKGDMEIEIRKLQHLIHEAKTSTEVRATPGNFLPEDIIASAEERMFKVKAALHALDRRLKLMKSAANMAKFTAMGRAQIEQNLTAMLQIDIRTLDRDELYRIADELQDHLNRGEAAGLDAAVLAEAEKMMEECIARAIAKQRVISNWSKARARISLLGKSIGSFHISTEEKIQKMEQEFQQMHEEGTTWFENMDFDRLGTFRTQLETMIEKSTEQFGDSIDEDLIDKSEELALQIGRYVESVLAEEEAMFALLSQARQLQKTIQFTSSERVQFENIKKFEQTIAAIEELLEDYDIEYGLGNLEDVVELDKDSPAGRSERGIDPVKMLQTRETMLQCISAIRRGPIYFGVSRQDMQNGVSVASLLPLQALLSKFERECEDGSLASDESVQLLADFARRIIRFGYPSVGKAFDSMKLKPRQEEQPIPLNEFQNRLALLGVKDEETTVKLFQMFEPFCIANFRHLLGSKVIADAQAALLNETSSGTRTAGKTSPGAVSPDLASEPSTYEPSTPASTRAGTPSVTSGYNSRPSSSHPSGRASLEPGSGITRPQSSNPRGSFGRSSIEAVPETVPQKQRPRTALPGSRT